MSEYHIRQLESTEFHLLLPLMENCFGLDVNVQYFRWKFVDNPAGFVVGFIAIAEDGEVAAYYGAIPEEYSIEGQVRVIYQSCDTMTHSRHRRKGLFQKLAIHCYNHLKEQGEIFVIGFGGKESTPGLYKFGWKPVFTVKNYFFPKAFSLFRMKSSEKDIIETTSYNLLESAITASNTESVIHSHKSIRNFLWRISNPQYEYKTIALRQGSTSEFASWLTYYVATGRIVLFDFHFDTDRARRLLVGYLKNMLSATPNKGIVAFCQEDSKYSKLLAKETFIYNPFNKGPLSYKTPFVIYTDEEQMQKYGDSNLWLINSYDYDAM